MGKKELSKVQASCWHVVGAECLMGLSFKAFALLEEADISMATSHKQLERKNFISPMEEDCLRYRSIEDVKWIS